MYDRDTEYAGCPVWRETLLEGYIVANIGESSRMTFSDDVLALNPDLKRAGARRKYGNQPTEVDGIRFDSIKEARDYQRLKLLEQAGEIINLRLQPEFVLQEAYTDADGNQQRAIIYRADFMWDDSHTGRTHVRDTKGYKYNAVFLMKEKMFRKRYPQYVYEVG